MNMFSKIMGTLLGDNAKPETSRPDTTVPRLVHWLPYRSYDPKCLTQKIFRHSNILRFGG